MSKKYIVISPYGKRKKGDVLPDSREVRRKLQEGGTVEELTDELLKKKKDEKIKKNKEFQKLQKSGKFKMEPKEVKNKMEPENLKNKGDKK